MKFILILSFFLFLKESNGQGKIYFLNQTGRPVWIQKRNILEIGSFPYVLDTVAETIQNIPNDAGSPTILNVMVVPQKGPYGTADGIYYLFKTSDTVIVKLNAKNQPIVTHISSPLRTKELSVGLAMMNYVGITPYYTLVKTAPQLYKLSMSTDWELRDKLIDSLSGPYVNSVESFCKKEGIDPLIGKLFKNHYRGQMMSDKLLVGYGLNPAVQIQLKKYYTDSLLKWSDEMNCEDCQNVFFYNLALREIYKIRFGNLDEHLFLNTVYSLTKGYSRNFLLSRYVVDRFEVSKNIEWLVKQYDSLCKDPLYNQMVHANYLIHRNSSGLGSSELAILLKGDKSKIGFTQLIASLKGKIVYIDFWASWCKPCIEEIPFSHLLKEKIKDSSIVMLYFSLDTDFSSWRESSKRFRIDDTNSYILTNPEKNKLAQKIKLGPIPRYIIIDKNGKIIRLDAGRPSDEETYHTLLQLANN